MDIAIVLGILGLPLWLIMRKMQGDIVSKIAQVLVVTTLVFVLYLFFTH